MQGCVQGSASLCTKMHCGAVDWHERGQAGSHLHVADSVNGGLLLTVSLAPECQREMKGWVGQSEIKGLQVYFVPYCHHFKVF